MIDVELPGPRVSFPPTGRWAATVAIAQQASRFPDCLPEAAILDKQLSRLDDREGALAHRIYTRVMQRWMTLASMLDRCLDQPFHMLEVRLQGVLLAGSAQLFFLDRLPVHAVIDETVEIAKAFIRPGAGGLTNAVLRKLALVREAAKVESMEAGPWTHDGRSFPLSDGGKMVLDREVWPAGSMEGFAGAVSLPMELLERWEQRFGQAETRRMALHSLCDPPVILNTAFAERPVGMSADTEPHRMRGHHVYVGSGSSLGTLLASRTDAWVQDPSSAEAVRGAAEHLQASPPACIVDLCAGQGTKTLQLLATFPQARVVATDIDFRRLETLAKRLAGHERAVVVPHAEVAAYLASSEAKQRGMASVDLVLVDVPCSNTGVLPRRLEARYRMAAAQQAAQMERLVQTQRQIAGDATRLLAPGGRLLYSTCSLEGEENEAQAAWIERQLGYRSMVGPGPRSRDARAAIRTRVPTGLPGEPAVSYSDGSYWTLLQRIGG